MLKGRCRNCFAKISLRYPFIEFITGLLFVIFFLKFGLEKIYFFYIIMIGYMVILAFIDIDKEIVPDGIVLCLIITGMIFGVFGINPGVTIFDGIIGAVIGGFILLIFNVFTNGQGVGEGDIKLIAAMGLCAGPVRITETIFYAFIIGGLCAAVLILYRWLKERIYKRKEKIYFVPFIAAAFILRALIN